MRDDLFSMDHFWSSLSSERDRFSLLSLIECKSTSRRWPEISSPRRWNHWTPAKTSKPNFTIRGAFPQNGNASFLLVSDHLFLVVCLFMIRGRRFGQVFDWHKMRNWALGKCLVSAPRPSFNWRFSASSPSPTSTTFRFLVKTSICWSRQIVVICRDGRSGWNYVSRWRCLVFCGDIWPIPWS